MFSLIVVMTAKFLTESDFTASQKGFSRPNCISAKNNACERCVQGSVCSTLACYLSRDDHHSGKS
jgi:hypothetical protein